jgi:hypothetical protein
LPVDGTLLCLTGNGRADALGCQGHDALGGGALVLCAEACDEERRMPHPNGMPTVQEVRTLSDEELVAHMDQPPRHRPDGSTGVVWPTMPSRSLATTIGNCEASFLARNAAPNAVAGACVSAPREAESMRMWRGG